MPKNNNNSNLVLEEYESEFSYQKPKSNLIISFNRVAFIFFVFLIISIIFSSKAIYLSGIKKVEGKLEIFKLINKKPILPSTKELNNNPSSRSAKLRYAIKINEGSDFSEFLNKFQNLLNIENLSEEL